MRKRLASVLAAVFLVPAALSAQAWDTPSFMTPGMQHDLGIYFVQPKDSDWGLAVDWRKPGQIGLGLRGEYVKYAPDVNRWALGGDIKGVIGPLEQPLELDWTGGVGVGFGDGGGSFVRIPVGLSLGARIVGSGLVFTPYVHPRVALAVFSGGGHSDSELQFDADLGLDLALTRSLVVRIGATLGDRSAFGAGVAFPLGR